MTEELHVETLAGELARFDRMDTEWMESAVCASTDPELFFPDRGGTPQDAKRICFTCPVRQDCFEYAMQMDSQLPTELVGVWGGTSMLDRRMLKRGHAVVLSKPCGMCGAEMPTGLAQFCSRRCELDRAYQLREERKTA